MPAKDEPRNEAGQDGDVTGDLACQVELLREQNQRMLERQDEQARQLERYNDRQRALFKVVAAAHGYMAKQILGALGD